LATSSDALAGQGAVGPSQLRKHAGFRSRFLPTPRDLIVYLPGLYEKSPRLRFPVLFMQDGQNLFDPATAFVPGMDWRVGQTADTLIEQGAIQPLIIVGIYNTGEKRVGEYTPSRDPKLGGGSADRYGRMLLEEILPFLRSRYRVLDGVGNTGIGGSSLGGLLSLYLGLKFSGRFGKLAVLSPSLWWNRRWILHFAARRRVKSRPRIWLDVGTKEGGNTLENARKLRDILLKKAWQAGANFRYEEIEGGQHNEGAWAQRVGPFLEFLFPPGKPAV
jgi:enterochelin esterase-like enzyme